MWQNIISACQSLGRWNAKEAVHPEGERWARWSKTRQEALSMLRLILLIIYIYSCRHECDFEKSQKTGCHHLMEKSLDVAVVLVFVCLVILLLLAGRHLLILSLPFRPFGGRFCRCRCLICPSSWLSAVDCRWCLAAVSPVSPSSSSSSSSAAN